MGLREGIDVPKLELCYELGFVGFPQNLPGFFWVVEEQRNIRDVFSDGKVISYLLRSNKYIKYFEDLIPYEFLNQTPDCDIVTIRSYVKAPLLSELLYILPESIGKYSLYINRDFISYRYNNKDLITFKDKFIANRFAKMILWLVKEGYIYIFKKLNENFSDFEIVKEQA